MTMRLARGSQVVWLAAWLGAGCAAEPVALSRGGVAGEMQQDEGEREAEASGTGTGTGTGETEAPAAAPSPPGSLKAGDTTLQKSVMGLARTIRVHVPTSIRQRKLPVVLALHGNGGQAADFVQTSGLLQLADSVGFVLVAPQGLARTIAVGGQTTPPLSWDAYNARAANADVQLFDVLLDELVATGSVDMKHLVVYGYSQGGYASVRYGREASGRLACAAVLAAGDAGGIPTGFTRKLAFSIQIGSNDSARNNAASLAQNLQTAGHPVSFHEIAGAGHSPMPGLAKTPLDDCLAAAGP